MFSKEVDLKLISLCFGNCDTGSSLKNTLTLFNVLQLEEKFRNSGKSIAHSKPMVSVGMATALDGSTMDATDFHGEDGLGNVHLKAPQFTARQEWIDLFSPENESATTTEVLENLPFVPSKNKSYEDILQILRDEEPDTIVIVAIGPLNNIAKAAEIDPIAFSRVKKVVSMGGSLTKMGNVTPYAEFNVFSDALAASRVFELTSIQAEISKKVPRKLDLTLFPLDITSNHSLLETDYLDVLREKGHLTVTTDGNTHVLAEPGSGSPLLEWTQVWLNTTFNTMRTIYGYDIMSPEELSKADPVALEMHDPLALYYGITSGGDGWQVESDVDIRVETTGEFTRGMTVRDVRKKPKRDEPVKNDFGVWLSTSTGNRLNIATKSPYDGPHFGKLLLSILFS